MSEILVCITDETYKFLSQSLEGEFVQLYSFYLTIVSHIVFLEKLLTKTTKDKSQGIIVTLVLKRRVFSINIVKIFSESYDDKIFEFKKHM